MTGRTQAGLGQGVARTDGLAAPVGGGEDGLGLLYDAAFGTIGWAAALVHFLDVFDSDACLICWHDLERGRCGVVEVAGIDRGEVVAIGADTDDLDLSRLDAERHPFLVPGGMEAGRDPTYRVGSDRFQHRATGLIHRQPGLMVVIDLLRRKGRAAFDPRDLAHQAALLEHLRRAWLIRALLRRSGMSSALPALFEVEDVLGLDLAGRAIGDGAGLPDGSAGRSPETPGPDGVGTASSLQEGHRSGGGPARPEPDGKIAFLQPGSSARGPRRPSGQAGRMEREATVTAIPLFGQAAPELRLRLLYKLTPAESRIATSLAHGHSLQDAADRLEISVTTVRTHLSRIYDKTGTSRQSELVALLLRGPARLDQA